MTKLSRRLPSMSGLAPCWRSVRLAALDTEANDLLYAIIRFGNERGITPSEVDEGVLAQMMEAARAAGHAHPQNIGMNTRRGLRILRALRPDLGLPDLPRPGRETPRADQWRALEPELRREIEAFIAGLGRTEASSITVRNLVLRGLAAAEEADVEIARLADLFGERGIAAVLSHEQFFGREGRQNASRSQFLDLARHHARTQRDVERHILVQSLIDDKSTFPTSRSPVSPGDLLAVGVLLQEGVCERLVAHTAGVVDLFVADPSRPSCANAQAALMVRLIIALTLHRKIAVQIAFAGPERCADLGCRPTLVGPDRTSGPIEEAVSKKTVNLVDRYFMTHRLAFGAPTSLFAHRDGRPKTAAALSEAVRRLGRTLDLELSPTILRTFSVAKLVAHMKSNPYGLDLIRIKDHLGIDQEVNFRSRFGALLTSDVYEQVSLSVLGR